MNFKRIFLLVLLLSVINVSWSANQSAVITKFWVETHSGPDNGITAHVDFSVKNCKDERVYARLELYDGNGNHWFGSVASHYCVGKGQPVSMFVYFEPTNNEQSYRDVKLHIPESGMQLKLGTNYYHAAVAIVLGWDTAARSKPCAFSAFGFGGDQGYPGWSSYSGPLNDKAPTPAVVNAANYAQSNTRQSNTYTYNSGSSSRGSTASTVVAAATIGILGYGLVKALSGSSSSSSKSSGSSSSSSSSSSYSSSPTRTCPACNGRGMEICSNCRGTGTAHTGFWGSNREPCRFCDAKGQFRCRTCYGKGRVR